MQFEDLQKINHLDTVIILPYYYIEQCFKSKHAKKLLAEDYVKMIEKIFSSNKDIKNMFDKDGIASNDFMYQKDAFICGAHNAFGLDFRRFSLRILRVVCDDEELKSIYDDYYLKVWEDIQNKEAYITEEDGSKTEITPEVLIKLYKSALMKVKKKINEKDAEQIGEERLYKSIASLFSNIVINDAKEKNITIQNLKFDPEYVKNGLIECIIRLTTYGNQLYKNLKYHLIVRDDFDIDKYAFILFSSLLESIKNDPQPNNVMYSIITYLDLIKDSKNDNLEYYAYNKKTDEYDSKYTYKNFLEDTMEYIKTHPDLNLDIIPSGFFDGWEINEIEEYLDMYTKEAERNFALVDPEYIFLPQEKTETISQSRRKIGNSKKENIELAIRKRALYDRNRSKIYVSLLGQNKFKGYVANVLTYGYVILEKYDEEKGCISNKSGAAYIMNIDNFNEVSKKSIQAIREIVKNQPKDMPVYQKINYVCHSGNSWEERLQAYFDQYTGIKKEHINQVIVDSTDRNLTSENNIIYKKEYKDSNKRKYKTV